MRDERDLDVAAYSLLQEEFLPPPIVADVIADALFRRGQDWEAANDLAIGIVNRAVARIERELVTEEGA